MAVRQTSTEVLRCDFGKPTKENMFFEIIEQIKPRAEYYGTNLDGSAGIGLRWQISVMDAESQSELLGILAECKAIIETEGKNQDLTSIKKMAKNSFLNVEMHYQKKAPPYYKDLIIRQPDLDSITKQFAKILSEAGFWQT